MIFLPRHERKKTVTRELSDKANAYFKSKYPNDVTRKSFCANYKKFVRFCRERFGCKTVEECGEHIGDYAAYLATETNYTASTIHSYLAAVCVYHGVGMNDFDKPRRHTSEYRKGRIDNGRTERSDNDICNPKYRRLVEFQRRVGLRRSELKRLTGSDFVLDESGNPCVLVKKGKGGKTQYQRILPNDIAFVASYFSDKGDDERIFTSDEKKNKLNLHRLRALHARDACRYYTERLQTEGEEYRRQLIREIEMRWSAHNRDKRTGRVKPINRKLLEGKFFLRGRNKAFAVAHGLPWVYDRLAMTAVSIFHLSHWRNDVTAESYMLVG